MAEIARLNTEVAKANPERVFSSPLNIVDELMLTRGEKIATLERWRVNVFQELDAGSEGMRTRGTSARHAVTLSEIDSAIKTLARA
jgi:hypothetical protein